jgi:acetyl-CoA acetyltransferase family protein
MRAARAAADGRFGGEIVPVVTATATVGADEHPRPGTTPEALAKLKPLVKPEGTVTAGNASGINDGACALLLASGAAVKAHGLTPRARYVAAAVSGVPPRVMGIGPVPASRKVLGRAGLTIDRMDVIELNEAFAAQALAVLRQLGVADDAPHVNPSGGAIALGHPLGASGARLVTAAMYQLGRTGGRYALCTMCIGVVQGIALVLERV